MKNTDILTIWKSYDQKLNENLLLNRKNAEDITKIKVRSFLTSMRPLKIFAILAGILWVVFVDTLIVLLFPVASPFFLISAGIQVLLTKLSIGVYLYQWVLIELVDIDEPVLTTQERIAHLQASTLWVIRILFLQLPVWTTFYLTQSLIESGGILFYTLQIGFTAGFTLLSIWLYRNISYENRDKKWFKLIFNGIEWNPIRKSMELLDQIKDYSTVRQ
ncbi:hypothetical protein QNI16_20070 [Cytophagaceae bacterium YF14B1]|uniref:Uncharacterized protein n=1 Tax=Xanthocytophaga flava TaxID=3048013 RepID=A0AAE3UA05_9BACT|nr:hypothetical protein [Xanthocytophaga flavus]MDJ1482808.1 hypothetical protein [Xanthocytophaga flavus]